MYINIYIIQIPLTYHKISITTGINLWGWKFGMEVIFVIFACLRTALQNSIRALPHYFQSSRFNLRTIGLTSQILNRIARLIRFLRYFNKYTTECSAHNWSNSTDRRVSEECEHFLETIGRGHPEYKGIFLGFCTAIIDYKSPRSKYTNHMARKKPQIFARSMFVAALLQS